MHPTLQTLFERLDDGLVWVSADGEIKYANSHATRMTGLKPGARLKEGRISKATQAIASGAVRQSMDMAYEASADDRLPLIHAHLTAGLAAGEAWMYLAPPAPYGDALALNNLMTVIRSDLAAPLAQLAKQLDGALTRQDAEALRTATLTAKSLSETLHRLVDLADLWQSDSLLANDRIELRPLMQRCWQASEGMAVARRLTVRFVTQIDETTMPVVYGSEFWLNRVLTESLGAALRAAPVGGTLDIDLRQMGPHALVVFRNSGMWPARAHGAVTLTQPQAAGPKGLPVPKTPASLPAADLVGLHLCQRIIELHGGQMREETEDGMRDFLIELPTGAPHGDVPNALLDAAQVQRYAADLSTLMARRRGATKPLT
jgi:signal transduction histidine kinase